MEKWEKLHIKIQLLNMIQENSFVKRHFEMVHDDDHTPVLFSYTNACGMSVARGIEAIDKYIAKCFSDMSELKKRGILDILGKELNFQ